MRKHLSTIFVLLCGLMASVFIWTRICELAEKSAKKDLTLICEAAYNQAFKDARRVLPNKQIDDNSYRPIIERPPISGTVPEEILAPPRCKEILREAGYDVKSESPPKHGPAKTRINDSI